MLYSYGFEFKDAIASTAQHRSLPLGPLLLPGDGSLVKSPLDPTVYLISEGKKHGFVSESVFRELGFKFSSVLTVTAPELNQMPQGPILKDGKARHLPGLDVSFNGTIFYLSSSNRHGFPSMDVYNSWNVDNDFSQVVPANQADLSIPEGEVVKKRVVN